MSILLEEFASILGLYIAIIVSLFNLIFWLLGNYFRVKIDAIDVYYAIGKFHIFTKTVNTIKLSLGFLPFGGYVKFRGMITDTETPLQPHDFNSKSKIIRLLIILSNPVFFTILGSLLISISSKISLLSMLKYISSVAVFMQPFEYAQPVWEQLFSNNIFLFGLLCLVVGISSLFGNINAIFQSQENLFVNIFATIMPLFFAVVFLRVIINYGTLKGFLLFYISTLFFGTISMLCFYFLAKVFKPIER